ncbi:molybdopterin-dependent oxidoreductase [Devosia sp. MC521]|uniref:molybdopterin-dependent oxidoreductase n=1 Tax=Devosia sp. MC521 TaxID=2759954 RepID=UPI0015F9DC84|nr:molybdopterin-dependent oxidoreductase [Devosia sp. MC521]MBJ6988858.1 molybdopterin-dependent oxidoreductase [Devosia sp. MC521]QMW63670.1 molybdopterin-dependent oxidoreductase [Devosia sp. MC521]
MNAQAPSRTIRSVCPHDCPSVCALDVDILPDGKVGRVRGAKDDPYTAGVICEKVARYAERIHHAERLTHPMRRVGPKGAGQWERITWDEALDEIATRFLAIETEHGAEAIWPYFYAGTMGHVQRDGIERLRATRGYSHQYDTICTGLSWPGYIAGTGLLGGVNPEQMAESDCVVIWGTNAVNTQINVMTHATRARKTRGAKIVVIDIYRTTTMDQADLALILRPGTDGALAVATMHILLRDSLADRDYMREYTDFSPEFESHLQARTPQWASEITGLSVDEIEAFARLVGENKKSFFRLGYGFSRQRNGATSVHAALSIPAMTGAWQYRGGGAFHSNSGTWGLDKSRLKGTFLQKGAPRALDMSEVGPILTGDAKALQGGGPVRAMIVQNTNPASVCPEQNRVREGFMRDDLFLVVHEQFLTETAELADIVLPATMFLEHNDYYTRGGHTRVLYGPAVVDRPGECWSNHELINALAIRLGETDPVFFTKDREVVADTFARSGYPALEEVEETGYVDRERPDDVARFAKGFNWEDGRYRFAPNWQEVADRKGYRWVCDPAIMPKFADHWAVNEVVTEALPFKLATSPARTFLNSSFNQTPGSLKREGEPSVFVHPQDAERLGIADGDAVLLGNDRGEVELTARIHTGLSTGVLIAEGLHRNKSHRGGKGINVLTSAIPAAPFGGVPFHDAAVWLKRAL